MDLNAQEVHLSHYWNIVYKRWKVALAILVVVMAATFAFSYLSKPLYRSTVRIHVDRDNRNQLLSQQTAQIQADIEVTRKAMQQYADTRGIIPANDPSNSTIHRLTKINADLGSSQSEYYAKQAAYETIALANPDTVVKSDPLVVQLNEEASRLEREYAQKLSTFLPQHAEMQRLRQNIEKTKQ